jgi:hypothetical protein
VKAQNEPPKAFDEWWDSVGYDECRQLSITKCARLAWRAAYAAAMEEAAKIAETVRLRFGFGTNPTDSYYNEEHACQDIACFCDDTREQIAAAIRASAKEEKP